MNLPHDEISRFERRLSEAAAEFAEHLRRDLAGAPAHGMPDAARQDVDALKLEEARLRRLARRNAASYDLNRPIAIRRLIARHGADRLSAS